MKSGFLSFCRQCRRIRLIVNYRCAVCDTEHSRRLRDKKRIKDEATRETVLKTQERLCPQCREMVPLDIVTEREMLGLLVRKYPGCPTCDTDLSEDSMEVTISMFNDFGIFYDSFKLGEPRATLTATVLLRHFKDYLPVDEEFRKDFLSWKEWTVTRIVDNVREATPPAKHSFAMFLEDFKSDTSEKLNVLVKRNFKNIDLKLELLSFFGFKEDVPPEKQVFTERLEEIMKNNSGVKQDPETLPSVEMYRYDQVFTQIMSDDDDYEDDEDEDEETGNKRNEPRFERRFTPVDVNLEEMAFKTRTSTMKKEDGVEKQMVTWHAALVIDNAGRSVFLYRPEGFVSKDERAASFESKKMLSTVLRTQADHDRERGDIFSEDFFNALPANDICYIAVKLGKPYLAEYDFQDIVFGAGERRDLISEPPEPAEGFSKPEPRDMMVRAISEKGKNIKRYKRVGICEKCLGITRPYLQEKWLCPECGSRDSARKHYCSGCQAEIGPGDSLCQGCTEFLI